MAGPTSDIKGAIHVKTESSPGVYETITVGTTSAIRVLSFAVERRGAWIIDRTDHVLTPDGVGSHDPAVGDRAWRFTFETDFIKPSTPGDLGTSPLEPLIRGCLLTVTENAATSVVLTPSTTYNLAATPQPFSIQFDTKGGRRYRAQGCVCTMVLKAPAAGKGLRAVWTVDGCYYDAVADANALSSVAYSNDGVPVVFKGWTLTDGLGTGDPLGVASFEFDFGTDMTDRTGGDAAEGFHPSFLDIRGPCRLMYDIEAQNETSWAAYGEIATPTGRTVSLSGGGVAIASASQSGFYLPPKEKASNNARRFDMECMLKSAADIGAHATVTLT